MNAVFTGLVESMGALRARVLRGPGARLSVATDLSGLAVGDSIAVQGVCLTVESLDPHGFDCHASAETLSRTTLGALSVGSRLNLERALLVSGRMGGHIVTGHVDGRAQFRGQQKLGDAHAMTFEFDAALARFIAPKGSVALDGVSLTVNGAARDCFDVMVIPHTFAQTTLGGLDPGREVNLEVDLLARYVARILESAVPSRGQEERDSLLLARLKSAGYL